MQQTPHPSQLITGTDWFIVRLFLDLILHLNRNRNRSLNLNRNLNLSLRTH